MSKYVIKVIIEVDNDCFLVEYYKSMTENGDVILTDDLADAALFDNEETCDNIIDHLRIVLSYIPRRILKKKCFYVNPKL